MKGRNNNLRNSNIRQRYPLNRNIIFSQSVIRTLNSCNKTNIELSTNFNNLTNNDVEFEKCEKDLIMQCLNVVCECQKIINECQLVSFRRVQILNNLNDRMTNIYNIRKYIGNNRAALHCDIQNRVINNNMNGDRKNDNQEFQKSSDMQCSSTTYEIDKNNTNYQGIESVEKLDDDKLKKESLEKGNIYETIETVEIISSGSIKNSNEMKNESRFQKQHLEEEYIPQRDIDKGKEIMN